VADTNTDWGISRQILEFIVSLNRCNIQLVSLPGVSNNKARNEGFKVSKGEYIAFLDDDDEWVPDKLEKQLESFNDDTSLVYSNYIVSNQYGSERTFFEEAQDIDDLSVRILGENVIGCTSMPLIRRQAFIDVGGFNESFKANQEWDLWIRILQDHKVKYSPTLAGTKYHSSDGISNKGLRRLAGWISLFIHHASKYQNNKEQFREALGFFIGEMFGNRMYVIGAIALPLYVILKDKEYKKQQ
jgi:glycosyltransferase involved in cell wall biosynthesis